MTTQRRHQLTRYVVSDYLAVNLGWLVCSVVRLALTYPGTLTMEMVLRHLVDGPVVTGQICIPLMMMALFWISGYYNNVFFKSRTDELVGTATSALVGAVLAYFIVLINDTGQDRLRNYEMLLLLFGCLFVPVYLCRVMITTRTARRIAGGHVLFDTLVVGTGMGSVSLAHRVQQGRNHSGFNIVGYVDTTGHGVRDSIDGLPVYSMEDLDDVVRERHIARFIIGPQHSGMRDTAAVINRLFAYGCSIYASPELGGMVLRRPRMRDVTGEPLHNISEVNIPASYVNCKRVLDIVVSSLVLLAISPVMAAVAIAVRRSSPGPVIYSQERVGYHKRPFNIYKFRTMVSDAEQYGPQLARDDDPRITRVGHFLRKYRLDELPQFWNVLKGDMSIVGPRPEREFYIRQIVAKAPYYALIHQVRPGITSWGMVKYGYASTVEDMIKRLQYELLYLENISLGVDLRIMFHTIDTVISGEGL